MRTRNSGTKAMLVATIAMTLAPAMMSVAATKAGRIKLVDPVSAASYADVVPFAWDFTPGKKVRTTSNVYLQASSDGYRWKTIDSRLPIRHGAYLWDTSDWPEGTYHVRTVVHKTFLLDKVGPITVDRTAPMAHITNPSQGDVIIEDALTVSSSVVMGTTNLEVDAYDFGSGVGEIEWALDGESIGEGTPLEYSFSLSPGPHTLSVTVTDRSGNVSHDSVEMIALPGPSVLISDTPELPEAPGGETPGLPEDVDPTDPMALLAWLLGEDFDPSTLPIDPLALLAMLLGEDFPPADPTTLIPTDPGNDPTGGLIPEDPALPDTTDPTGGIPLPEEIDDPTSLLPTP